MPKLSSQKLSRKMIDQILTAFGAVTTVALIGAGGLAWWGYTFTTSQVTNELASQQIFFPPKGSAVLASSEIGPFLDQYAGQQLTTGDQARAFADHFIAVHLQEVAGGKTYAEVSTEAQANPTNTKLAAEKQTLFQGETLRGMLLNAYAFWMVGQLAGLAAWLAFAAAGVMAILTLLGFWHMRRA